MARLRRVREGGGDQVGEPTADHLELELDVGEVGGAGAVLGEVVHGAHPLPDRSRCRRLVGEQLPGELLQLLVDLLEADRRQVGHVGDALVEVAQPREVVEDRLAAGDPGEPAPDRRQPPRRPAGPRLPAPRRRRRWRRGGVGLDVHQPPLDLGGGTLAHDRVDRVPEREVVEHPTVDEVAVGHGLAPLGIRREELPLQSGRVKPPSRQGRPEVAAGQRRERAGEGGGRPGRERQRPVVPFAELVELVVEAEAHHVAVGPVVHDPVADRDVAAVALQVGQRDHQLDRLVPRHQRRPLDTRSGAVHLGERVVQQPAHLVAPQRRPHPQRMGHRLQAEQREPQPRRQPPREPQQLADVAVLEPQVAQRVLRGVPGDRLGQVDPVDPAGRGPRHDVDDHPRPHLVAVVQLPQPLPVEMLRGPLLERVALLVLPERQRREQQLVDLLGDPVHVDRQRDTAVADEGEADLLDGLAGLGAVGFWLPHHRAAPLSPTAVTERDHGGSGGGSQGATARTRPCARDHTTSAPQLLATIRLGRGACRPLVKYRCPEAMPRTTPGRLIAHTTAELLPRLVLAASVCAQRPAGLQQL